MKTLLSSVLNYILLFNDSVVVSFEYSIEVHCITLIHNYFWVRHSNIDSFVTLVLFFIQCYAPVYTVDFYSFNFLLSFCPTWLVCCNACDCTQLESHHKKGSLRRLNKLNFEHNDPIQTVPVHRSFTRPIIIIALYIQDLKSIAFRIPPPTHLHTLLYIIAV